MPFSSTRWWLPAPRRNLRTDVLEVQLQRPIRFSEAKMDKMDQSQVEEIRRRGGAVIEDYAFDPQRQLQSYSRMETPDLTVNMRASGSSVRAVRAI